MKTTKIADSTMVFLDFSRSGASEFYVFCTLVGYHFPHPFFIHFLLDFCSTLGSTSRLKSMRLRIFSCIVFSIFFKSFFIQKPFFQDTRKRTRRHKAVPSGHVVKHHILEKTWILYGSGTLFYTCRFAWPLGKGYGVR